MNKRTLLLVILLALATTAAVAVTFRSPSVTKHPILEIYLNDQLIKAEVVSAPADVKQGLSDRKSMARDEGMLFELGHRDVHTFWMNRMHFNLDLIWIDGDKVVEIAENLPAPKFGEYPFTYTPEADSERVLEVNAGVVKETGLKVGDTVGGLTNP